jgi:hypothetical protein
MCKGPIFDLFCHSLTFNVALSPQTNPTRAIKFLFPADLAKNPIDLVSVGLADESNVYEWEILVMGPDGTLYEGGFFKARLVFPPDFPNMPRE